MNLYLKEVFLGGGDGGIIFASVHFLWNYVLMIVYCHGEMTWWLRELAVLSEDLGSVHTYTHECIHTCTLMETFVHIN